MAKAEPLDPTEDLLWRSLMRIVTCLPRRLDSELRRAVGLSSNEYIALMSLSEAPGRELRMSDLADATALSPSRITRLVDELQARGLVRKRATPEDGRAIITRLTPAGMARLKRGWLVHLRSARARVFDQVDPATKADAARALAQIVARLDERSA
jgi:DNA-binding MarR family transcriptional regulator